MIIREFVLGTFFVLLATVAWAQDAAVPQDDVLQRYALATENLDDAVASLPEDAAASRTSLDQAFSALLTLSRGSSGTLSQSIDRVFERARTAIDNRSVTDLAVQTDVLRGGFQRLLYESALTSAVEGDTERARGRMLRLAQDVGLGDARIERLENESGAGALRRVFEAGVAEGVSARLGRLAEGGTPADRDAAYREFASAYGDYLLVQDSPRLSGETNRRFVEAANALVDGDDETFATSVAALRDELSALREAADAGLAEAEPGADEAAEGEGAPADDAEIDPAGEDVPDDGLPLQDAPGESGGPGEGGDPADENAIPTGETTDDAAATDGGSAGDAESETALRERIESENEAARREAVVNDLESLGVAEDDRERLADVLLSRDLESVADAETALAALSSRLSAHVLRGEVGSARARLDEFRTLYEGALAPVAAGVAPEADASMRDTIARLGDAPALRSEDAALLASEVRAFGEGLRDAPEDESHAWIDRASSWWSGPVRPAVMILLALLTILPLRLLDLAFGGGNRNWRLVGTALFLLLLPVMYEGVAGAAALLAEPLSLPVLETLTTWSVFQNDLTQMVWAALTLLALLFASIGFYGICLQFGVLGRNRAAARAPSATNTGDDTLVDWDDEF